MRPRVQLASKSFYYIWLILLILALSKVRKSYAAGEGVTEAEAAEGEAGIEEEDDPHRLPKSQCVGKVTNAWRHYKVTSPYKWINDAIAALNAVRHGRDPKLQVLIKKDEVCRLAQYCADAEIEQEASPVCICNAEDVVEDWLTYHEPRSAGQFLNGSVEPNITKLKATAKTEEWEGTHLFEPQAKYVCIAFAKSVEKDVIIVNILYQDHETASLSLSSRSILNEDEICPNAPEEFNNVVVTTPPHWITAAMYTINFYRNAYNAPDLETQSTEGRLCKIAQLRANEIAKNDDIDFNSNSTTSACGEQIWTYNRIKWKDLDAANEDLMPNPNFAPEVWYKERNLADGEEGKAPHFTQMVWKDSVECCIVYATNAAKTKSYVVALYWPPGNVEGKFKENVLGAGMLIGSPILMLISLIFGLFGVKCMI